MNTPYLQQGNIFVVPILRQRLTFAVQVNRAAHELNLGEQDLVAVALPESVRDATRQAVARLPRVSLVISSMPSADPREVFPVTPADGLVEAIRIAADKRTPLEFIDQEVAPGHLVNHFCLADDEWPDDWLALEQGAERYLDLVTGRLAHPPARYDPVDGWRELHMAAQLQTLTGRHRRILFVCHATHVRPIQQLLRRPLLLLDDGPSALPTPTYTIREPSLAILLRYLDSIPRLVEAYEKQRSRGKGHTFDKQTALLQELTELNRASPDLPLSIRNYQAFTQILTRLLEYEHRVSPDFETVLRACRSCFSRVFTERALRHLVGYHDQVQAERVGRVGDTREAVFEIKAVPTRTSPAVYVGRGCTQLKHYYELIPLSGDQEGDDLGGSAPDISPGVVVEMDRRARAPRPKRRPNSRWMETWPPQDDFMAEMRRKAYALARTRADRQVTSLEFRGSLLDGVDFRRTLRSHFKRQPRLYVQQAVPLRLPRADRHEPVVWLSEGFQSADVSEPDSFTIFWCGERKHWRVPWWATKTVTGETQLHDRFGAPVTIAIYAVHGAVSFLDGPDPTAKQLRALSPERLRRIPEVDNLEHIDGVADWISLEYGLELSLSRWWDIMLAAALHYANESVLLVGPKRFVVPEDVRRAFAARGKSVVRVPSARFTPDERRRIGVEYEIMHDYEPRGDVVDPQHLAFVVEHFGDLMRSYWS